MTDHDDNALGLEAITQEQDTPYLRRAGEEGDYVVTLPAIAGGRPKRFRAKAGDPSLAHEVARAYRDRYLPASHRARALRAESCARDGRMSHGVLDREHTSLGKPGIDVVGTGQGPRDGTDRRIQASARDHASEKLLTMRYSIRRYGFATALRYALRKRLEWERRFYAHRSKLDAETWHLLISAVYKQFGEKKMRLADLDHPGSVSQHKDGIQARLNIHGRTISRWFANRAHSSAYEARAAAIAWLLRASASRRASTQNIRSRVTRANATTGTLGVCRRIIRDGRNKAETVIYEASVQINGRGYPVRFRVGRVGAVDPLQEQIAYIAACDCRAGYESAHAAGQTFDKTPWRHWKRQYGFPMPFAI